MLMDIMNNSTVLANIARSVTNNLGALGWVFYLIICTVVIYAQVESTLFVSCIHHKILSVVMIGNMDTLLLFDVMTCLQLTFHYSLGSSTLKTTFTTTAWLTTRKQLAATLS